MSLELASDIDTRTCKHLGRYKEREVLVDERTQWRAGVYGGDLII